MWRPLGTCPVCPVLNPALGQTEVFVPISLIQTFNLLYSYRQLAVRVVVSVIAVF